MRKVAFIAIMIFFISILGACRQAPINDRYNVDNQADKGETRPVLLGEVTLALIGTFTFNPTDVETLREDIFRPGYFSLFDVLVHLSEEGHITLHYRFDEDMNTYVIESINGMHYWWYNAYYDGGWPEPSVFRIDHYPYKDKMTFRMIQRTDEELNTMYRTYRDEVERLNANDGKVIIPMITIEGRDETWTFYDVEIKAHNLRNDTFQEGVITAIDAILTLGEEGLITYDLKWYASIGTAGVVKSYWVNSINGDTNVGRCGFVYEAGDPEFMFFLGNHIHIPSDTRILNSPQYLKYFWVCI